MSSSPALPHDATAASRESSSPQATEGQDVPKSSPEDRGRQPSMRERESKVILAIVYICEDFGTSRFTWSSRR